MATFYCVARQLILNYLAAYKAKTRQLSIRPSRAYYEFESTKSATRTAAESEQPTAF